ncbi:MAG TPA: carboxypeptidase-like regulatory domain-containing protein [Terriglobales bacterium]|nr:carboxypeptidase-like regulatory domain-containing protein [Terriglobales bacterium]
MPRKFFRNLFLAAIFAIMFALIMPPSLHAQGGATGAISGSVQDASGAVVPNAQVQLVNTSTGETIRTETTNASGLFTFNLIPAGTYTVQVSAPSFAQTTLRNVAVQVTETTRLNVSLKAKTFEEKVEVMADVAPVQTADATTGESLGGGTIRELPLATRNFQQLLALSPGASSSLNSAAQLGRGDVRINVNGGREDNNNYQIEGIGANDPTNIGELAYTPLPSPDSIQEFRVSTSLYDATQGRNGGGNINAILKGGTSQLHFDVFEYFRNTVLNANDFFLKRNEILLGEPQTRPDIKQNIFGGSVGGPIGPKAPLGFFFLNYQGTRQRSGDSPGTIISTVIPYVPLAARDGTAASLSQAFFGNTTTPIDPVAVKLLNFKSNQFGPTANGYIYPLPNVAPGTPAGTLVPFVVSKPGQFTDNQFTANWDKEFRAGKDHLSERFFYSNVETDEPFGGDSFTLQTGGVPQENNLNFPMNIPVRDRFGSLTETHIFSNALVNEFRFGVSVIGWKFLSVPVVTNTDLGITRPTDNATSDIYRFQFNSSGFQFGPHPTHPLTNLSDTLSYLDTLSYVRGSHSLRFGGEIIRTDIRKNIPVSDNGFLFFGPAGPISDFQNFLMGNLAGSLTDSGVSNHDYGVPAFALFAQDDYRATKSLTLNLGLRTEILGAPYDKNCRIVNIDPSLSNPASSNYTGQPFVYPKCVAQYNLPGITGTLGRGATRNDYATVWAPRIGFAYDLFGHQTTAIRGGYGIYSIREDVGGIDNLTLQPPFVPGAAPVGPVNLSNFLNGLIPPVGVLDKSFTPQASFFTGFTTNFACAFPSGAPGAPTPDSTQFPCFSGNIPFFFSPLVPLHFVAPTMQQWNFTIQHSLGKSWALETGYVGTKGTHLREVSNIDQARIASPSNPVIVPGANCDGSLVGPNQQCAIVQNTFFNIGARAPFPGIGPFNVEKFAADSNSHYHGLHAMVTHRFSQGLYVQSSYTYSKAIDDTSSSQVAFLSRFNDQTNPRETRGPSDFDRTHRFVTSYAYTLPEFGAPGSFTRHALANWDVSGVFTWQSGLPFSIFDSAGGGAFGNAPPSLATPTFAAGATCGSGLTSGSVESRLNGFLNRQAFLNDGPVDASNPLGVADPTATGFGNVGRNCFRGPRQFNMDFSIGKTFRFTERQSLKFTAEFFNLTNTPSFANPSVTDINSVAPTSSTFGPISSVVGTPRLIQFALRFSY